MFKREPRMPKIKFNCKVCGKEVTDYVQNRSKYCSKKCWFASEESKQLVSKNGYITTRRWASKMGKTTHARLKKKLGIKRYKAEQKRRFQIMLAKNPNHQSEAGKLGGKKAWTPELARMGGLAHCKKYPNHMQDVQARMKKANPESYHQHHVNIGKLTQKKHPLQSRDNAMKSIKIMREQKPFWWQGVPYHSMAEREVAKKFLKHGVVDKFVEGVNCHVRVYGRTNSLEADFLVNGIFIEYHPIVSFYERKETLEEHYNRKRKILDEAGYKGNKLILFDKLKDFENKVLPMLN